MFGRCLRTKRIQLYLIVFSRLLTIQPRFILLSKHINTPIKLNNTGFIVPLCVNYINERKKHITLPGFEHLYEYSHWNLYPITHRYFWHQFHPQVTKQIFKKSSIIFLKPNNDGTCCQATDRCVCHNSHKMRRTIHYNIYIYIYMFTRHI